MNNGGGTQKQELFKKGRTGNRGGPGGGVALRGHAWDR